MSLIKFPNPRFNSYEGIVAVGGELTTANLLNAYAHGIFPWPTTGWPLPWFCPETRAVLYFKQLHIPRSLRRVINKREFRFTIDVAFEQVIRACAGTPRKHESGTWINGAVLRAYTELYEIGRAHSVEAWAGDELVGGVYGVDAGGAFAGESMFQLRTGASKLALLHLIEHLQQRGLDWLDAQVMTPHIAALGAVEIERDEFLDQLAQTQKRDLKLF